MSSRFKYNVVDRDDDGYYVTRWDRAVPVDVIADNRDDALSKLWALMGTAPRGRYWTARLVSVTPEGVQS